MIIDIHSHVYPKGYLKKLEEREELPRVDRDESGRPKITHRSFHNMVTKPFFDMEERIREMNKFKIDIQVLSLANPWLDFFEPTKAVGLAKATNDEIAEATNKHPDRFVGLASLPLNSGEAAVEEMNRAVNILGLRGVVVGTNIAGRPLASPKHLPVFEKAEELGIPVFVHPTEPPAATSMRDYGLVHLIGFLFDTTLELSRLILSGVLDRYPNLKLVASHLGGALPYIIGRLDAAYHSVPGCKGNAKRQPSEYLKKLYFDTISYSESALMCAYSVVGPEKLLFGTDYPFPIADPPKLIESISNLSLPPKQKQMIFVDNAARLLKI